MGPCPFRHGYSTSKADPRAQETLQWGHALSGMDTYFVFSRMPFLLNASMGPCPFRHGYLAVGAGRRQNRGLQWGHALSGMDTRPAAAKRPGPYRLQWGHALSGMDTRFFLPASFAFLLCFNGAMPFQAWIRAGRRLFRKSP